MELDELKNVWASLDERLNKQEQLKESIIKEMIYEKSNKSVSKLLNFEIFSITTCLLVLPIVAYLYNTLLGTLFMEKLFCYVMFFFLTVSIIWSSMLIYHLMKIDFTKNVSHNSLYINKYNVLIKKNKIAAIFIMVILYAFGIYLYAAKHVSVTLWIFLACVYVIGLIISYFAYKKLYDNNIHIIQKSLEELKELEEE
jgi:hypothetical protein